MCWHPKITNKMLHASIFTQLLSGLVKNVEVKDNANSKNTLDQIKGF